LIFFVDEASFFVRNTFLDDLKDLESKQGVVSVDVPLDVLE
jgi:hypothetical protein